jgi:hypothetical protein
MRRKGNGQRRGEKRSYPGSCGKGGPKKQVETEGYFICPNKACDYYGIADEHTYVLVDIICSCSMISIS